MRRPWQLFSPIVFYRFCHWIHRFSASPFVESKQTSKHTSQCLEVNIKISSKNPKLLTGFGANKAIGISLPLALSGRHY